MTLHQASLEKASGEKVAKRFTLFGGKYHKYEKARHHFNVSAHLYKAEGNWGEAAAAYMRAYDMAVKRKEEVEEIEDLRNAAHMFRLNKDSCAVQYFERLAELLLEQGSERQTARVAETVAELYEQNVRDQSLASNWYAKASVLWSRNGSTRKAQELELQSARLLALRGNYKEALRIFEEIGKTYTQDKTLRSLARREFFRASLCYLALLTPLRMEEGIEAFTVVLRSYEKYDPMFTKSTWEHIFLTKILKAFGDIDLEAFDQALNEYRSVIPLDDLNGKLLNVIQKNLEKSTISER